MNRFWIVVIKVILIIMAAEIGWFLGVINK
jgi:hypothetical protein